MKAPMTLRAERAQRFGRRVRRRVRRLVTGPPPFSVLYVTDQWDASYRYRCEHGVRQLRASGIPANVIPLGEPTLFAALPSYSIVVQRCVRSRVIEV